MAGWLAGLEMLPVGRGGEQRIIWAVLANKFGGFASLSFSLDIFGTEVMYQIVQKHPIITKEILHIIVILFRGCNRAVLCIIFFLSSNDID